jgi:hypothetical protein
MPREKESTRASKEQSGEDRGEKTEPSQRETGEWRRSRKWTKGRYLFLFLFFLLRLGPWILPQEECFHGEGKNEWAEQLQVQAWLWALPEWQRCSSPPSSRASPATPTPTMVRDSCPLYALNLVIFLLLKRIFALAYTKNAAFARFCSDFSLCFLDPQWIEGAEGRSVRGASSSSGCSQIARTPMLKSAPLYPTISFDCKWIQGSYHLVLQ